jgi:hypothetical protein
MLALRLLPMYCASAATDKFARALGKNVRSLAIEIACSSGVVPKSEVPNGAAPAALVARNCWASALIVGGTKQKGLLASAIVLGGVQSLDALLGVASRARSEQLLGSVAACAAPHASKKKISAGTLR